MVAAAPAAEFPRRHVAADADFGAWSTAEPYYRELVERRVESIDDLERWLIDLGEVDSCFDEEGTARYTAMTCQTDDPVRKQRFLDFLENVKPHREPWHHKLREKFVALAARFPLPRKRYEVMERGAKEAIAIYRDENVPLFTEDEKLQTEYQEVTAAMTVTYQGKELTIQQVARFLEEPDRAVREETYRLAAGRYLQDAEAIDALYDQMVALRHKIARNAGCADYREYAFRSYQRFDYTPTDCIAFHDAIEQVVVPACAKLAEQRRTKLGLATLRPWDMAVDAENRPPLRPFESDEQLVARASRVFHRVNADLGRQFDTLNERQVLDLGSRKGKAPGGYQAVFAERRLPFIFMNAVGTERDVRTLLHEGGHAFHSWACRNEPFKEYRHAPTEFCEVASMGMECLSLPFTDEFFGADTKRARRRFFEEIVNFFPFMAMVDAFQHHVYTHVDHGIERRKDEWVKLFRRFNPYLDVTGLDAFVRHSWHRKLHFFEVPFYYVEYGIAQLGALQVWRNSLDDFERAVNFYRNGLALGGSRPLPELFEAAGLKFDFSQRTLKPLIDAVMEEIARLE